MNVGLACAGTDGLRFYLHQYGNSVALKLKDKDGIDWYILSLTPDGVVNRYEYIGADSGLQLDQKRRIVIENP